MIVILLFCNIFSLGGTMMPPPLATAAMFQPPPSLPAFPPTFSPIFYWPHPSPPVSPTNYYNHGSIPAIPQQATLVNHNSLNSILSLFYYSMIKFDSKIISKFDFEELKLHLI